MVLRSGGARNFKNVFDPEAKTKDVLMEHARLDRANIGKQWKTSRLSTGNKDLEFEAIIKAKNKVKVDNSHNQALFNKVGNKFKSVKAPVKAPVKGNLMKGKLGGKLGKAGLIGLTGLGVAGLGYGAYKALNDN